MGERTSRPKRMGSFKRISQMGHGLSFGAGGLSGFNARNSGRHRRRGARLPSRRGGEPAALLQTVDTERFKMDFVAADVRRLILIAAAVGKVRDSLPRLLRETKWIRRNIKWAG